MKTLKSKVEKLPIFKPKILKKTYKWEKEK